MKSEQSAFLIAGVNSGSGKTTVTLGLLRALARRGLAVAPFKCGPDYIDPLFHRIAARRDSHNLDTFLMGCDGVRDSFRRNAAAADAAVAEGVMGLFDGSRPGSAAGSSAELAELLELPVLLTVNARGLSGSIAPLVRGFCDWNPRLRIAGVIANFTGSARHGELLAESLRIAGLPPLLGALTRDEAVALPERHLGLATDAEADGLIERTADKVERELDLDRLLDLTRRPVPAGPAAAPPVPVRARLGIARDAAFQFYYADNLAMLEARGVELVPFSPLADSALPSGLGGLYFGGGFPELYAKRLAANRAMLDAVREFAASGRPVWGECGGLLYLLEELTDFDGRRHALAGVLPGRAKMNRKLAALGYRELETRVPSCFGPAGTRLRGHEFHYSSAELPSGVVPLFAARNLRGEAVPSAAGCAAGNVTGSYMHLHFASNPAVPDAFAEALK